MNLYNWDGTFFEVTSPDLGPSTVSTADVISLSMVEEMAKMDSGTVKLLDRRHIYSRILRPGVKLKVSWGVRPRFGPPSERSPVEVVINSPGGGGSQSGEVTYECSFMAVGFRGDDAVRWYESGTKGDVVADVMTRLGISTRNISFSRQSEAISSGTKVAQYESDFRFLVRLADEWRAAFRIGRDARGMPVAMFVDYSLLKVASAAFTGRSSLSLSYGAAGANVSSYTWKDNSMNAANGQGVRVVVIDGKPQMYRTVIDGETVRTYRLVPERIEAEMAVRDLAGRTSLLRDYASVRDFESVRRFFVEDSTTTSPQGSGLEASVQMVGDPTCTAGMVASFDSGFPDRLGAIDRTWWVRSVRHDISRSGYLMSLDVADAYSFSPTGVKL